MSRVDDLLKQMIYVTENVDKVVSDKKHSGKKVVGVLPIYAPEELVHAAGMFPVGCWGGSTNISMAAKYLPPFACSIMQAVMEYAERGTYKDLDALLVPTPCDTLKAISQNLIYACPDQKIIILTHPQNNKMEAGVIFAKSEFAKVKAQLEAVAGTTISDQVINESIEIYNDHRSALMKFTEIIANNPGVLSAVNRHYVIKSGLYMEKEEHTKLIRELNSILKAEPKMDWPGKKIVLAGILAEPNGLLEIFDEFSLAVVADELAQESRQFRTLVPEGKDPLERLARQWQNREACSVILDSEKKRAKHIAALAKANQADGVIFCQMKFCDPEEFDYPSIKKACEDAQIPLLHLESDQLSDSTGQYRTRIQAFCELLGH
ncbi:2-hydroxyacyl-CoA dehydratase subunit D [Geosporobacter ferrireducens]|uniref:Phenyllactate dehydratase n=1 Tax=Geosporobacter ferrireducens TaxID=1424294 RepID=A0A1D8GK73_9FIRM|nr:2-hydroxyacyl-CoA dehydratase family protein [Geosporobacter ferrireducens]AOT71311.1 hypothetical protein Gferi_18160 [Geosporobacter ferrireducens]